MFLHLYIVCGGFRATLAELNSYNKDHIALKAKNVYYLALHRKVKCGGLLLFRIVGNVSQIL